MEITLLKEFEGKCVRLILNNNWIYNNVIFTITKNGLISFQDKFGAEVILEAKTIVNISSANKTGENHES